MNIDHIKYFCDAVEFQSLAKSAKSNNVSPGAVSQGIARLEQLFNENILTHKKNSFELTEKGRQLYKLSLPLLQQYQNIQFELSSEEKMQGEFLFITQQSLAEHFLPKILASYNKKYPLVTPKLTLGNTSIARERLKSKTVDFSILLDNVGIENCNKREIGSGEFVLYKSKKYNASDKKFLVTGETPECFDFQKKYQKCFKSPPTISMEIKSWGVLKKMANEGHGIALLPDYILTSAEKKNVVKYFKLSSYKIIAAWPLSKVLSMKSKLFIESI